MAKRKSDRPMCAYCGLKPGIEDEHVIARAFFPAPRPPRNEMILVPACSDCNRGVWTDGSREMSADEEYVRSLIILEWHAGNHPAAHKLLNAEVRRSVEKRPNMAKLILNNEHRSDLVLESGLIVPDVLATQIDWPRFRRVFHKITLGLYYHEMRQRLPDDQETVVEVLSIVGVGQSEKLNDPLVRQLMQETRLQGPRRLVDGVFSYAFRSDNSLPGTIWVLAFYDGAYVLVATRRRAASNA